MIHALNSTATECILDKFKELLSATPSGDHLQITVDAARDLQAAIEELESEILELRAVPAEAAPEPTHLRLLFSTAKMLGPGYEISGEPDKEAQERSAIIRDVIRERAEDCARRGLPVNDHPTKYTVRWMLQSILQSWARGEPHGISASLLRRILAQFSLEELRYYVSQERDCEFPEFLGPEPQIHVIETPRVTPNRIRKAPATIRSIDSARSATQRPGPRGA